jgi:hypothetical protein
MRKLMQKAWSVKTHGQALGTSLCDSLRESGGLDLLIENCSSGDENLRLHSAEVLEQCLTAENRTYLASHDNGLEKVVKALSESTSTLPRTSSGRHQRKTYPTFNQPISLAAAAASSPEQHQLQHDADVNFSRVRTGILENLFKHSEGTCGDIIKMGGLKAVLEECRKSDVETLRHCASALANLSLYGGSENQQVNQSFFFFCFLHFKEDSLTDLVAGFCSDSLSPFTDLVAVFVMS